MDNQDQVLNIMKQITTVFEHSHDLVIKAKQNSNDMNKVVNYFNTIKDNMTTVRAINTISGKPISRMIVSLTYRIDDIINRVFSLGFNKVINELDQATKADFYSLAKI